MMLFTVLSAALLVSVAHGFSPSSSPSLGAARTKPMIGGSTTRTTSTLGRQLSSPSLKTPLRAHFEGTDPEKLYYFMQAGRYSFYFCFFGASGAAGIGRRAFPLFYDKEVEKRRLQKESVGQSLGGEGMGLSPLCLYPEDLSVADVKKIVNNPLSVEQIVDKFPIEDNFLAKKGYLTYEAFRRANKGANPLAIRAVFDSLNNNSDVQRPMESQQKLDSFRKNVNNVKTALLSASLARLSSVVTLCFLLFICDYQAFVVEMIHGWFPYWPGFDDFPSSFFDPDTGISAIGNYYMWDPPELPPELQYK